MESDIFGTLVETPKYCFCLVVGLTAKKCNETTKTVYATTNDKMPPYEFMICVNMPEMIWCSYIIYSSVQPSTKPLRDANLIYGV